MSQQDYTFYRKQKSIEDLILEVAQSQVALDKLLNRAINEDAGSQNPKLAADIAELKRKIEASNKALAIANKLKDKDGNAAHRSNIMSKQAEFARKMKMLKAKASEIDSGSHIGVGEVAKKKDDAVAAKDAKANRRKELAEKRKKERAEQKERSAKLRAERQEAKRQAKNKK